MRDDSEGASTLYRNWEYKASLHSTLKMLPCLNREEISLREFNTQPYLRWLWIHLEEAQDVTVPEDRGNVSVEAQYTTAPERARNTFIRCYRDWREKNGSFGSELNTLPYKRSLRISSVQALHLPCLKREISDISEWDQPITDPLMFWNRFKGIRMAA